MKLVLAGGFDDKGYMKNDNLFHIHLTLNLSEGEYLDYAYFYGMVHGEKMK